MKKILYILIFTLPLTAVAQLSDKRYSAVEDFYSEINIENIELNIESINIDYNQNYLSINSIIKYKYGLICSDDGKVLLRTYMVNNKLPVKLYKKNTYYLRLDTYFSSKYYKIKI